METTLLERSSAGVKAQIVTSGIGVLLLLILVTWLVGIVFTWAPNLKQLLIVSTWILFVGTWGIKSLISWFGWQSARYEIGPESLILHLKSGKFGTAQTVYRYESIISLRMVQGFWGKQFGYGDVFITIPKMDKEIVLRDIERPSEQLSEIRNRVAERSQHTNLIT